MAACRQVGVAAAFVVQAGELEMASPTDQEEGASVFQADQVVGLDDFAGPSFVLQQVEQHP